MVFGLFFKLLSVLLVNTQNPVKYKVLAKISKLVYFADIKNYILKLCQICFLIAFHVILGKLRNVLFFCLHFLSVLSLNAFSNYVNTDK